MLMRFLYALITYLLSPVYAFYWISRGFGERAYWDRFGQRFGAGYPRLDDGSIWFHAVSVCEVRRPPPARASPARRASAAFSATP